MKIVLRLAGLAMLIGGVLFFGRMAPIFAVMPSDMAFPPESTTELIRLAEIAGARWQLSHILGLIAAGLFILGYWGHAASLKTAGHQIVGTGAAVIATLGFGLFAIALVIDGFPLPAAALAHAAGGSEAPSLATVDDIHQRALVFFTPGVFTMFIAIGLLSSRMLHGLVHSRWLGWFGMLVAIAGPTAYLTGIAGPNWNKLQIGGSVMMLAFLWHFLTGLVALFGRGLKPE